jgi:hypothetical protein
LEIRGRREMSFYEEAEAEAEAKAEAKADL